MAPPLQGLPLDIRALSGILGSVSIVCWVVVFSPQIIENFRRQSADGLSVVFIVIWTLGDIFNILGAVLQKVLPTMLILAIYYALADVVLLSQYFYYEGFTIKDRVPPTKSITQSQPTENDPLLSPPPLPPSPPFLTAHPDQHRQSSDSFRERFLSVDPTHLSPATPLISNHANAREPPPSPPSTSRGIMFNLFTVLMVVAAGVFGWYISNSRHPLPKKPAYENIEFNLWGQIFGWICAILYLTSRIPQLLLNFRRKSTEGISMLFFLFACIGNLTYVLSIFAYEPVCKIRKHCNPGETAALYWKYIAVNASWILGSAGSLSLDICVFAQYFVYKGYECDSSSDEEVSPVEDAREELVRSRRERREAI